MQIVNDNGCGWINDLHSRSNIRVLNKSEECEWLIIGAGYTGLSAARKLSQLHSHQKIIHEIHYHGTGKNHMICFSIMPYLIHFYMKY